MLIQFKVSINVEKKSIHTDSIIIRNRFENAQYSKPPTRIGSCTFLSCNSPPESTHMAFHVCWWYVYLLFLKCCPPNISGHPGLATSQEATHLAKISKEHADSMLQCPLNGSYLNYNYVCSSLKDSMSNSPIKTYAPTSFGVMDSDSTEATQLKSSELNDSRMVGPAKRRLLTAVDCCHTKFLSTFSTPISD